MPTNEQNRRSRRFKRDSILFVFALLLVSYGAAFGKAQTAAIMTAGVAILMSPAILRLDEERKRNGNGE